MALPRVIASRRARAWIALVCIGLMLIAVNIIAGRNRTLAERSTNNLFDRIKHRATAALNSVNAQRNEPSISINRNACMEYQCVIAS